MRFIDRVDELRRLDRLAGQKASGLIALWGRRRVGKTRLLVEWSMQYQGLYTVADQSAEAIQRRYFAEAAASRFAGFAEVEYPDWKSLLGHLAQACRQTDWRGPLILDEFPYLISACGSLASQLQNWIDHEAREAGLLVAIAGSSQRMMQGLVLGASSPLYGRAIEAMELRPLLAGYLLEALGVSDPVDAVRAYSIWGGIPRYWELAASFGKNLDAAVDHLVLDPLGSLHREPDRLLLEETPPATALRPVLDAIGSGAHRVSEIASRLSQPATSLSRPLTRLAELGLIARDQPFGESEKSSKRTLYRIGDPFTRFWFRVVAPHRAALAEASAAIRHRIWTQFRETLEAEAWESLCRESVPRLHQLPIPLAAQGPWEPARRWWAGNEPEWDIVAWSIDRQKLLLGEVKWLSQEASVARLDTLAQGLMQKGVPRGLPEAHFEKVYVLFVPRVGRESHQLRSSVHVLDAAQVLQALR